MKLLVEVVCLIATFQLVSSQATIDFSEQTASEEVRRAIMGLQFSTITGGDHIKYEISNIRITHFDAQTAHLTNPSEMNYQLRLGGLRLSGEGDIRAYKTVKFLWFSRTIEVKSAVFATFNDVDITQGARLVVKGEKVKVVPTDCSASIGSVSLKTEGQGFVGTLLSTIFNLAKSIFKDKIKSMITRMICPNIKKELTKYLSEMNLLKILPLLG